MKATANAVLAVLLAAPALAGEGKWTPQQVLAQGPGWVKAQGFGLRAVRAMVSGFDGKIIAESLEHGGALPAGDGVVSVAREPAERIPRAVRRALRRAIRVD